MLALALNLLLATSPALGQKAEYISPPRAPLTLVKLEDKAARAQAVLLLDPSSATSGFISQPKSPWRVLGWLMPSKLVKNKLLTTLNEGFAPMIRQSGNDFSFGVLGQDFLASNTVLIDRRQGTIEVFDETTISKLAEANATQVKPMTLTRNRLEVGVGDQGFHLVCEQYPSKKGLDVEFGIAAPAIGDQSFSSLALFTKRGSRTSLSLGDLSYDRIILDVKGKRFIGLDRWDASTTSGLLSQVMGCRVFRDGNSLCISVPPLFFARDVGPGIWQIDRINDAPIDWDSPTMKTLFNERSASQEALQEAFIKLVKDISIRVKKDAKTATFKVPGLLTDKDLEPIR